jgi:hypothetical protein
MLAYSPLFPIIIDYGDKYREVTEQDEKGILLALQRRQRVHRIRLEMAALKLRRLIVAMGREFPMLEYLYIKPITDDEEDLILPESFKAPHLRLFLLTAVTHSPGTFLFCNNSRYWK